MILDVDAQALFFITITGVFLFLLVTQVFRAWVNKKTVCLNKSKVQDRDHLSQKVNTRSFFIVNLSVLFVVIIFLLAPGVSSFKADALTGQILLNKGLSLLIIPPVILFVALLYLNKKGDLSWLKTFRKK